MHTAGCLIAFRVRNVGHVGGHIVNLELVVDLQANAQAVDRMAGLLGALAWNDEGVSFHICERSFDVPKTIFSFKA